MVSRRTFVKLGLGSVVMAATGFPALGAAAEGAPGGKKKRKAKQAAPVEAKRGPQTILILGGTGFLGPHLVDSARRQGHTVTLFNRGKTNPGLFPDVEKLQGDRDGDLESLEGRKWDAVIDTSGYVPRIVKASADLLGPNVKQYIFISTISVYSDNSIVGMDETGPLATIADVTNEEVNVNYGALKALSEKAAEASMTGRVTNIRPGLIVGPLDPTDRLTYWPVRVSRGGEVLAPGKPADGMQFVDARDLADFCIEAVENGHVGVYNATGPAGGLPIGTVLDTCKQVSASDARFTWVDAKFLEENGVAAWSDMPAWVPAVDGYEGFATVSAARASAKGLRFRPVKDTVTDTLAWWKTLPEERRAKLRAGLKPEREAEVLAKWHARKTGT